MRNRTLRQQVLYGAIVGVLFLVGLPVASLAGVRGIEAIRNGDPSTVFVSWLLSLGAAIVPVVALAIYLHWLGTTSRGAGQQEMHVPTRSEDWLYGIGTTLAVVAAVPILSFAYRGWGDARASGDLAYAVGYGVLGLVYIAFAGFCVERYVQWMR